jgi:hypothetical protein
MSPLYSRARRVTARCTRRPPAERERPRLKPGVRPPNQRRFGSRTIRVGIL